MWDFNKLINQEGAMYYWDNIGNIIDGYSFETVKKRKKNGSYEVYNIPLSFDIETTSFYVGNEKRATMYVWTFCFYGVCFYGRTWEEFIKFLDIIKKKLCVNVEKRIIIYVHNLSYEFQFIRGLFKWVDIFAMKERQPIYAITECGIEFRCSYFLSNSSLETIGKNLNKYKIRKLVGDLDYSKIRNSITHLTFREMRYCENDVRVVVAYIQECIEENGNILKIPLTNTGYVRRYCREKMIGKTKNNETKKLKQLLRNLTLTLDEYYMLKRAFQGGFTHSNAYNSNMVHENVASFDFTSSYPAVMLLEQFPMSCGKKVNISSYKELKIYCEKYCCIFDVEFLDIVEKPNINEHYIPIYKCLLKENYIEDNGRLVEADRIRLTITNIDFELIEKMYDFKDIKIGAFIIYRKGYLPKQFLQTILDLYKDKTELKGIESESVNYMRKKGMLNSLYGMIVTDIIRNKVLFDDEGWGNEEVDYNDAIDNYNNDKKRFLFYPWGVFVTAYARRNLFSLILKCGSDYIYSDTDSCKLTNYEKYMTYINEYNYNINKKIKKVCDYYGLKEEDFSPKNIKGKSCTIGVWDFEGVYDKFKTLGAKRYMTTTNGINSLTVSGLNKKKAIPYLESLTDDIYDVFCDNMYIPRGHTGKQTHSYIDYEIKGVLKDYQGNDCEYHEYSCVHLEESEFTLSLTDKYIELLLNINLRR